MTKIHIEIDDKKIAELIQVYLYELTGITWSTEEISIEVKSKQNYKSEWEKTTFRAILDGVL